MAVPCFWRKNSSLNSITLFFRTMLSISSMIRSGGVWGSGSGHSFRALMQAWIPSSCGMFVYSDDTSMLTRMASFGILDW